MSRKNHNEDTWKESELRAAFAEANKPRSSKEATLRDKSGKLNTTLERDRDRERQKEGDRERRKEGEGDRDKGKRRGEDRDRGKQIEGDRDKRIEVHRDKRRDVDRDQEKQKDGDRERRRDGDRDREKPKETVRDREKGKEGDREKRKESDRDREKRSDGDRDREKRKEGDREKRKEGDRDREKRSDGDRDREKRKEGDGDRNREKRKEIDLDREKRNEVDRKKRNEGDRDGEKQIDGDHDKRKNQEKRKDADRDREKRKDGDRDLEKRKKDTEKDYGKENGHRHVVDEDVEDAYDDDDFEDESITQNSSESPSVSATVNGSLYNAVRAQNSQMANILAAMNQENEVHKRSHVSPERVQQLSLQPKAIINFTSVGQREHNKSVSSRTLIRGRELLRLIELDRVEFDMFELRPVEEYQLYMRSYGRTNCEQASCQTKDDAMEQEVQSERIFTRTRWQQHPTEDIEGSGLAEAADEDDGESSENVAHIRAQREEERPRSEKGLSSLLNCLLKLLQEESEPEVRNYDRSGDTLLSKALSSGYTSLTTKFAGGGKNRLENASPVSSSSNLLAFAPYQNASLLSCHSQEQLSLWSAHEPTEPRMFLNCPAAPRAACFAPSAWSMVFAGLVDGSLCVWDLQEASDVHPEAVSLNADVIAKGRTPTFITAATDDNHPVPILDLATLGRAGAGVNLSRRDDAAFQIVTLDESGLVMVWVATKTARTDLAGSESDPGLFPGGRLRLSRSSILRPRLEAPPTVMCAPLADTTRLLVGTQLGQVIVVSRVGKRRLAFRRHYDSFSAVSALHCSPFAEAYVLVGYTDGYVALFNSISQAGPLMQWNVCQATIAQVFWSPSRPAVFYVLEELEQNSGGRLFAWDLLQSEWKAAYSETGSRLCRLALSNDFHSTGYGESSGRPHLATLAADGRIQVHDVASAFAQGGLDETYQFTNLVQSYA